MRLLWIERHEYHKNGYGSFHLDNLKIPLLKTDNIDLKLKIWCTFTSGEEDGFLSTFLPHVVSGFFVVTVSPCLIIRDLNLKLLCDYS